MSLPSFQSKVTFLLGIPTRTHSRQSRYTIKRRNWQSKIQIASSQTIRSRPSSTLNSSTWKNSIQRKSKKIQKERALRETLRLILLRRGWGELQLAICLAQWNMFLIPTIGKRNWIGRKESFTKANSYLELFDS